jgi:hypothetical protein
MIPRRSAEPTPLTPVELRPFGQTGLHVSALGFGGANIGFTDISDKTLDRMFGAAVELGVNLIDTAAMYGDSEEKIGRALHGRRQQYLICTAGSNGRCNTIQCVDSTMLPKRTHLFGCTRSKPSQGSVPADLTLASDLAFVFNASRVRP